MGNVPSMKKALILSVLMIILAGCSTPEKTPAEEAQNIAENQYVSLEIEKLQTQLENGAVTEKYAQEKLKQILKERQRQNSGDTAAILEKVGNEDPMIQKALEQMLEYRK